MSATIFDHEPSPDRIDGRAAPVLDIVVPVHNEAHDLGPSIERLHDFVRASLPFACRITIVDNASTDATWDVAGRLAGRLPVVHTLRLAEKGRGRALRAAWSQSNASVLVYMDVDLSTDLAALLPLVAPLLSGHSDLSIGTRLSRTARVIRGPKREVISRGYNTVLHAALGTRFSDAQCGFKAIRADCAQVLLPLVQDDEWFFDTELLVLAERAGMRIHEIPVDWTDDPDSRVDILATAMSDLRGVARLVRALATDRIPLPSGRRDNMPPPPLAAQVLRFAAIGVLSTLAYLGIYLVARTALSAQAANALALVVTAVGNTAANRRWTFAVRGRMGALRHQLQGLIVFAAALLVTGLSLMTLAAVDPHPSRRTELAVLVVANLAATVLRFVALRGWVFALRRRSARAPQPSTSGSIS
jgi:putative flippase GtrA